MAARKKLRSNLAEILEERGISLRELSRRIEHRPESVRLLAKNELSRIPVELIEGVCTELELELSELFTMENNTEITEG